MENNTPQESPSPKIDNPTKIAVGVILALALGLFGYAGIQIFGGPSEEEMAEQIQQCALAKLAREDMNAAGAKILAGANPMQMHLDRMKECIRELGLEGKMTTVDQIYR